MFSEIARRYEILHELGAGGMGVVYEALDKETGRRVALKTLVKISASAILRFKQEFRGLADIDHPNLVRLYELQEAKGIWFYTMELVEGQDLLCYVRGTSRHPSTLTGPNSPSSRLASIEASPIPPAVTGPSSMTASSEDTLASGNISSSSSGTFPQDDRRPTGPELTYDRHRLVSALSQLTEALQVIHRDGKVHRDIKPSNILVTREGRVVLLDFGLVMGADQEDEDQPTGAGFAGTAAYMAPEAASGHDVGPASDWYSVGVIIYEILTGRLPFQGKALEIILKKQTQTPQSPLVLNPKCDGDLADLAMKLLEPVPDKRAGADMILARLGQSQARLSKQHSGRFDIEGRDLFVGRTKELERLEACWQRTMEGHGSVMLVTGPSGIGKTALIKHFKDRVRTSTTGKPFLFSGRCYERETVPFKAFDAVVDRITSSLVRAERRGASIIVPADMEHLDSMFPVLGRVKAFKAQTAQRDLVYALDPSESRKRAFLAFVALLETMAKSRPMLIFIDDVQWIDNDSIDLLDTIVRRLQRSDGAMQRIMFLLARRPTLETPGRETIDKLVRDGKIEELRLHPLSYEDARALARSLLDKTNISGSHIEEHVAAESSGNPFFIGEMVRILVQRSKTGRPSDEQGLNLSLEDVLVERISDLSEKGRRILNTLAVAGKRIPHSVLASAAAVPMSASDWWDEISSLRGRRLLRCNGYRGRDLVEIYHDKIRETLTARLDEAQRRIFHENLARAMEAEPSVSVHLLAEHWLAAGKGDRAKDYVISGARQAAGMFAFERAAVLFAKAIDLETERDRLVELLLGMGDALANAGNVAKSADAYSRAAALAEDLLVRLDARYKAADQKLKGGYLDQGLDEIRAVLAEVGHSMPKPGKSALLWAGYERTRLKLRGMTYQATPRADIPAEDLMALDVLWSVSAGLSVAEPVLSTMFQTRLMRRALDLGDETMIAAGLAMEASLLAASGASKITRARRLVSRAEALARQMGDDKILGRVLLAHTLVAFFAGEWQTCIDWGRRTREHIRLHCHGMGWEMSMAQTFIGFSLMKTGDIAALRKLVWPLLDEARRSGNRFLIANMAAMPQAWLAEDRTEELSEMLDHVLDTWPADRYQMHHWYRLFGRGELLLYLGRPEAAWNAMQADDKRLRHSYVSRVAVIAIQIMRLKGRVALAMAEKSTGKERQRFLNIARKAIRGLYREGFSYGDAWADLLQAGVKWLESHDEKQTARALRKAVGSLRASDMILDALAAKWRLADVLHRSDDREEIRKDIANLGVQSPHRMLKVLAPGFTSKTPK